MAPDRPPLSSEVVLAASIACQRVKERSVGYRELRHRVLDLDREGRPYWGDDEEIEVLDLRARIEERV